VGLKRRGFLLSSPSRVAAAAVAYYVFSKPPRVAAHAPLPGQPDAPAAGAVARSCQVTSRDTYIVPPARKTRHLATDAQPHRGRDTQQVRSYARDSVRRDIDLILHGGLAFRLVITERNSDAVAGHPSTEACRSATTDATAPAAQPSERVLL